jgi:hypothetical protein
MGGRHCPPAPLDLCMELPPITILSPEIQASFYFLDTLEKSFPSYAHASYCFYKQAIIHERPEYIYTGNA